MKDHEYDFGVEVFIDVPIFKGIVKVVAHLDYECTTHEGGHPMYGVCSGDQHIAICEMHFTRVGRRN